MKAIKAIALLAVLGTTTACTEELLGGVGYEVHKRDKTVDRGIDSKHLSQLKAGVWTDPQGCDHWIIDDGVEGYLSPRVDKYGKPVCSGTGAPSTAVGPYKDGSAFYDPI